MQKIPVNPDIDDVELRYCTWLKMMIDIMQPKNLYVVLGRGAAKTTDIVAERSMDVCYDMPHSYQAIIGDTYTNLLKNVVPSLLEGWNRKGWVEGYHYVVDDKPPKHFLQPYKTPQNYKHTISTFLGNFFNYISMDTPSSGAGNSYQHGYIDESKYIEKKRVDKMFPALRGDVTLFGHSAFFRGLTCTTDYPNVLMPGEHDWILEKDADMDKKQIESLLAISIELNDKKIALLKAQRKNNNAVIKKLEKQVLNLSIAHLRARFDSTFFYIASSFANLDVLTLDFFKTSLAALGEEEFNTSILSLKPEVEVGKKFYFALDEYKHIYKDGIKDNWYQKFSLGDDAETDSSALRYCDPDKPLELGVDFGDMISFVFAQLKSKDLYVLKNIYTIPKDGSSREICDKFLEFFAPQRNKVLYMHYDRSGNQYQKVSRDWAAEIKRFIEYDKDGRATGWRVELKSRGMGNIEQQTEFLLAKNMMQETLKGLPKIHIDQYQCRELLSSMSVATQIVKPNKKNVKQIFKNKTSEKIAMEKRPMQSTNLSDALKYLICRREWLVLLREEKIDWSAPEVVE